MKELERLKTLLTHWREHNEEHAETYRNWAEKARSSGEEDLAGILARISAETRKLTGLFDEALQKIGR